MTGRDDAALVSAALAGDADAFGDMFDRYGEGIYSFCLSRLRNSEQAADATQNVFVRAIEKLDGLRNPERLRAWLFAIAQRQIVDTARARTRTSPSELPDMADETVDHSSDLIAAENAQLLWDAAGSLQPRDLELLELEYRHGLEGADLADALGVSTSHLQVLQSRSRDRVGAAVGALVLARTGADRCADLAELLDGWSGEFTLALRSQLTRHANGCATCSQLREEETRAELRRSLLPLAALPFMLKARTLGEMGNVFSPRTRGSRPQTDNWAWRRDGFPAERNTTAGARSARRAPLVVAVVAVLALIVAGVLINRASEPATDTAATAAATGSAPTSDGTNTAVVEPASTLSPADADPVEATTPGRSTMTIPITTSTVVVIPIGAPPPGSTPTFSTAPSGTTTISSVVPNLAPAIGRITIEDPVCAGNPADLLVLAADVDGTVVTVTATTPAGTFDLVGDGPYSGSVELGAVGSVDVTITATDDQGSAASQIATTSTQLCLTPTSSPFNP